MPTANRTPLADQIAKVPQKHDNDNPLWQGPCDSGPLGGITQSMLARFICCRERFRLKYVCGLEPPDKWNHYIGYGNMWHECEEVFARTNDLDKALGNLDDYTTTQLNRYPFQKEEITKWYSVCQVQFPEYVEYWAAHPDVQNRRPLLQEETFDVPYTLPSGRVVHLRGKWDSVDLITDEVTGPAGGVYLQENKTKSDIWEQYVERQLKFDLQTMMYLVALSASKSDSWGPINGVRYNVVKRPLSGGKGSIKPHKAKATKYKITPAETSEQFYERLRRDYIAKEPEYWFFRVRSEVSEHDYKMFRETCFDPLLEQLCVWYDAVVKGCVNEPLYGWAHNFRTPFGIYNVLQEGGATEYDAYLETGSEAGLRRVTSLFPEL